MFNKGKREERARGRKEREFTSAPSEPGAVVARLVVFEQLQEIEFVVVVFQVRLVQHCVPMDAVLTVHMCL